MKEKVLFLCTHNSARSQMAEGLLRKMYGKYYDVYSAGISPSGIIPYTIKVMEEIGIDISHQRSKSILDFKGKKFDYIVTVCDKAKELCPFFPNGKHYLHKSFQDPVKNINNEQEALEVFRKVRDEIKKWIEKEFWKERRNEIS